MSNETTDGRVLARRNDERVLKALHKYGWLRARDLAALIWMRTGKRARDALRLETVQVDPPSRRMAQRTLARLRMSKKVLNMRAPDGSQIYGLAEAGVRSLADMGIAAKSGKDQIRRVSLSHYHHRRLTNEVAVLGAMLGYRVSTEAEIAAGRWFGGLDGIHGKRPDVALRDGKGVWLVEVERSRRNARDYQKLLNWLLSLWPVGRRAEPLPSGYELRQVVIVGSDAFMRKLKNDMVRLGWTEQQAHQRLLHLSLLYMDEAKLIRTVKRNA
ncbi:MAG: hypothetical protein AB1344_10950 [Pseudomonadota bacterium]